LKESTPSTNIPKTSLKEVVPPLTQTTNLPKPSSTQPTNLPQSSLAQSTTLPKSTLKETTTHQQTTSLSEKTQFVSFKY
jgi:hypothetical protein